MRLIDADKLKHEAEHCIETTDAFIELIDQQPIVEDYEDEEVPCGGGPWEWVGRIRLVTGELKVIMDGETIEDKDDSHGPKEW